MIHDTPLAILPERTRMLVALSYAKYAADGNPPCTHYMGFSIDQINAQIDHFDKEAWDRCDDEARLKLT